MSLSAARNAARKALEGLYDGLAVIVEYQPVRDEKTGITAHREVVVCEDVPCRLSYQSVQPAQQSESAASITQGIKLFLAPEIEVRPGSKITVTQAGETTEYQCSGPPAVYFTHQEVVLSLFERWA